MKRANSKKRELAEDLETDVPAKRLRTGSKKAERQDMKGPGDNHPSKASKRSKSSKLSDLSKPSTLDGDNKRKHLDEQELTGESSGDIKHVKTASSKNTVQPMPATRK